MCSLQHESADWQTDVGTWYGLQHWSTVHGYRVGIIISRRLGMRWDVDVDGREHRHVCCAGDSTMDETDEIPEGLV